MRTISCFTLFAALAVFVPLPLVAEEAALRNEAGAALSKAATHYREKVARHGGYVYYCSPDFTRRLGEGVAGPEEIWVQPPGTPSVGLAYLAAHKATGDKFYLDAARETGKSLIYGQLASGGWTASIDFDPRGPRIGQYRNGKGRGRNNSTLDDGISQTAIGFLARLDGELEFKDSAVHEAVTIASDALLKAQFPCGAFPQVWTGPVPDVAGKQASFPAYEWRTEGRIKNYWDMYTLNDGLAGTVAATLLELHAVYQDDKYLAALRRLGDFLILAQMPDPQPAWAQQYSHDMQPIWARRFEPPAVTGGESQDVLETLLRIYRVTGDKKYLSPIPRALAYLKKSELADGRLARYYELQTNKPLYMTRRGDEYSLTYDDSNLPDHYGWKVASRLAAIQKGYEIALQAAPQVAANSTMPDATAVRKIVADLDAQGRWLSTYAGERLTGQPKFKPGEQYLSSEVFARNVQTLADYLSATQR